MQTGIYKKTELIKYTLYMHYETHLPAERNASFNFYSGWNLEELVGEEENKCIMESGLQVCIAMASATKMGTKGL